MEQLWQIVDFVRTMRMRLRFGELSRAPLRLLQLKLREDYAECDWMARAADAWDADLRRDIRERDTSLQALQDALSVRELLFGALPAVQHAELRAFRQAGQAQAELIICGRVTREDTNVSRVLSLAMRAKLNGFRFCLEEGELKPLETDETSGGVA